jgi:membrane protein DedA with SNARE-associated domain
MLNDVLQALAAAVVALISSTGYAGIALLMAIESACIPIPSEIIMPFSGYLVSQGQLSLIGVATAGAIGCNLGSTIAYFIGALGGRRFVEKWGRYVFLSTADIDMAERFFARFGPATVFLCRLLPVVRTFIALPAGFARMSQWKFQVYTFVGSWLWCYALAYVGLVLGRNWETDPTLKAIFHNADIVVVALVALGVIWISLRRWRRAA